MRGVNDAHGHMAGDELLARLARRLESALVGDGHVYRLGGVQLCALLMDTGAAATRVVSTACGALNARDYAVGCRAATVELPARGEEHRRRAAPRGRAAGTLRACCDRSRLTSRNAAPRPGWAAARRRSPASTTPAS